MDNNAPFSLQGRTALITGSSRGIGRAIALAFARHGANVAIHYAARAEAAEEVASQARVFGVTAATVGGNLAEAPAAAAVYSKAVAALGGVDILVLNASVQHRRPWNEITLAEFDEQVNLNLRASLLLMQLAIPSMSERRWGRVLAVGSVQQTVPSPEMAIYAATKCAQLSLVRNIAKQVSETGVTVNNLAPGFIQTERNAQVMTDPARASRVQSRIAVGFTGQPDDCVGAALLLCSDAGRYITGADFYVDGGWSL